MAEPSRLPMTITDVDEDSLVHCARFLDLKDISNMAQSCKFLNRVAYSDSIWHRFFKDRWPEQTPSNLSGVREAYLSRLTDLQQFKFDDPLVAEIPVDAKPCSHLYLNRNDVIFSQGPLINSMRIDSFLQGRDSLVSLSDHRARITCMRLFPLKGLSFSRNEAEMNENVLVTSSCDHSIRLWWKGSCQRCFRGHNGPVSVLSDKLLGDETTKVFASGGEDNTVRLWSLNSCGKRGQHALKATLYGHEKTVVLMSVARHKASLLVSMSKDSKVRVWDTTTSSSARDISCVGMTSVPGAPVGMACHDSLVYVAAGSSVAAVDLRTMRKVLGISGSEGKLYSFETMPSKFLVCTGGVGRAKLWDIRKSTGTAEAPDPVAELDGHCGPVAHLHMDPYKIVTAGPKDTHVNIWESQTGTQLNSLSCSSIDTAGCSAMAVDGCRIVTSGCSQESGVGILRYQDFNNATCSLSSGHNGEIGSKFWHPGTYSDSEESDS